MWHVMCDSCLGTGNLSSTSGLECVAVLARCQGGPFFYLGRLLVSTTHP